jgi:hypothetical protein
VTPKGLDIFNSLFFSRDFLYFADNIRIHHLTKKFLILYITQSLSKMDGKKYHRD